MTRSQSTKDAQKRYYDKNRKKLIKSSRKRHLDNPDDYREYMRNYMAKMKKFKL